MFGTAETVQVQFLHPTSLALLTEIIVKNVLLEKESATGNELCTDFVHGESWLIPPFRRDALSVVHDLSNQQLQKAVAHVDADSIECMHAPFLQKFPPLLEHSAHQKYMRDFLTDTLTFVYFPPRILNLMCPDILFLSVAAQHVVLAAEKRSRVHF